MCLRHDPMDGIADFPRGWIVEAPESQSTPHPNSGFIHMSLVTKAQISVRPVRVGILADQYQKRDRVRRS